MSFWSEFQSSSQEEWEAKITKDLRGRSLDINKDYNPIIFRSNKSTESNFPDQTYLNADFNLKELSNSQLLESLGYGLNSITLINGEFKDSILKDVMHNIINTNVIFSSDDLLETKYSWLNWKKGQGDIAGSLRYDPINYIHKNGNWFNSKESDLNNWMQFYDECSELDFQCIYVDGSIFGNCAYSPAIQIGYISSQLNEYFELLKISDQRKIKVIIRTAVGVNYFEEIAKLRALRNVIFSIATHRKLNINLILECVTSSSALSPIDIDTNLLRITSTAMASFIGGADIISNLPFDFFTDNKNKNARRLSINISHIIKEESKIHEYIDPMKGSHVIEEMTDQFKDNSWKLFKSIEDEGGWLSYLNSENILKQNKEHVLKKSNDIINGDLSIIGFNKYRLPSDDHLKFTTKSKKSKDSSFMELNMKELI